MPACCPSVREVERLLGILAVYARDELWLRVHHWYHLAEQPDQVWFAAVDGTGRPLYDRAGRTRPHTLQLHSSELDLVPGLLVHVRRAGPGVTVQIESPAGARFSASRFADVPA
jgi:hypothetical protein